jgi:dienelactone hydrolase
MRSFIRTALPLLALFIFGGNAAAQFRTEIHPILTKTPSTIDFLNGKVDGTAATIAGELRIPTFGTNKLPAVILVHGSGGVGNNVITWAAELNKLGIAAFILDTFTGRGIVSTIADQSLLSGFAMQYDAYRALEVLAKHPRIDPDRIVIMGFSKGATPSLYSSMARFQKLYGPTGVKFAGHIALYAPCNTGYVEDLVTTGAPIRLFHGLDDNYTLAEHCREYADKLKQTGADVAFFGYAGAHHSYDGSTIPAPIQLPNAITARKCRFTERPQGSLVNEETGRVPSWNDPCIERGATVAHSATALEETRKEVAAFLKTLFKM